MASSQPPLPTTFPIHTRSLQLLSAHHPHLHYPSHPHDTLYAPMVALCELCIVFTVVAVMLTIHGAHAKTRR